MTTNQLMMLLDIYRGTFDGSRHMGTVNEDINTLASRGLFKNEIGELSKKGKNLVETLLRVAALGEYE